MTSNELINKIIRGAEAYYKETELDNASLSDIDNSIDALAQEWMEVQAVTDPTYSSPGKVTKFLRDVANEVLKDIATKYSETTVVTITFITQRLIDLLIQRYHITALDPYLIPLEILAALIYAKFLKTLKKNL